MEIKIANLTALVRGKEMSLYQRSLALNEWHNLLDRLKNTQKTIEDLQARVDELSLRLRNSHRRGIEPTKCEKCGAVFIPHLVKPLTICDKCADSFTL